MKRISSLALAASLLAPAARAEMFSQAQIERYVAAADIYENPSKDLTKEQVKERERQRLSSYVGRSGPGTDGYKRVIDGGFIALGSAALLSGAFDYEASLLAKQRCGSGCNEMNPVTRFLMRQNRAAYYGVHGTGIGLLAFEAYKKKKRNSEDWAVPFLFPITFHGLGGTIAITYVYRFR